MGFTRAEITNIKVIIDQKLSRTRRVFQKGLNNRDVAKKASTIDINQTLKSGNGNMFPTKAV